MKADDPAFKALCALVVDIHGKFLTRPVIFSPIAFDQATTTAELELLHTDVGFACLAIDDLINETNVIIYRFLCVALWPNPFIQTSPFSTDIRKSKTRLVRRQSLSQYGIILGLNSSKPPV